MVRSQGKYFSKHELNRILMLLRESEMTLPEIAERMRCSRSAVAAINRKFQIRRYEGKRSEWSLNYIASANTQPFDAGAVELQELVVEYSLSDRS